MATSDTHLHPLVTRLRDILEADDSLTQQQVAAELGVSLRTVHYWANDEVTPQKRYRPQLAAWLDRREEQAA